MHDDFDKALEYIVERAGNINIYDIKLDGDYDDLLEAYFSNSEILKLYSLEEDIIYDSQSEHVFSHLFTDFMKDETSRV